MLLDLENMVSVQQDLSQDAGSYLSTYSIDLGAAGTLYQGDSVLKGVGRGSTPWMFCQMIEKLSTGSSPTLLVDLVMADDDALTSNLTVLLSTQAIAAAVAVAGYSFRLGPLPIGISKRYLGLQYTIGTATTTTGTITAGLAWDLQSSHIT